MIPRRTLCLVSALTALGFSGPATAQPMTVNVLGGGLGQVMAVNLAGPPSAQYLLVLSLTTGPTALPAPHIPSIDVGFDLLDLAVILPGFLGALPGSGSLSLPLPIPNDPVLDDLNINFQNLRIANGHFVEKSNLYRVTFDTPGQYAFTLQNLLQPRAFSTTDVLNDGSVLVAGGGTGSITTALGLNSAERYTPGLEKFTALPNMNSARALHRSTELQDGRVLLTGGVDSLGAPVATAEIFNPATNAFAAVGPMAMPRVGHTASLLPDGRVLVVGGSASLLDATAFITSASPTSEIFNPATNGFNPGPSLSSPRTFHDATRLNDGRVLVSGGLTFTILIGIPLPDFSSAAQLYTQNTGAGTFGGNLAMGTKRAGHTSIVIPDGRALIVGGGSGTVLAPTILASCQLFNPATSTFANTGSLATARAIAGLVRLPDGRIHGSGGAQGNLLSPTSVQTCETWIAGAWSPAGSMLVSRSGHGAVLLPDQSVGLIAGGGGPLNLSLDTAEVFQP